MRVTSISLECFNTALSPSGLLSFEFRVYGLFAQRVASEHLRTCCVVLSCGISMPFTLMSSLGSALESNAFLLICSISESMTSRGVVYVFGSIGRYGTSAVIFVSLSE